MNIISRIIEAVSGIILLILGARLFLRLFGANPETPFVEFVYNISEPLLAPFRGIFPAEGVATGGTLETVTIVAMIVYALVAYILMAIIDSASGHKETVVVREERVE